MAASIVQAKFDVSQAGSSQATIAISPNTPFTSGNYVWVCCWGSATMATATISDSVNTYTARGDTGFNTAWARHWTAPVATGTPTITVTPAADRNMSIMLVEVTGVDPTNPVDLADQQWQNWSNTNFPASPMNVVDTIYADELIMGCVGTAPAVGNVRDIGANTGWTEHSEVITGPSICLIYRNVTSTGNYDPDFTMPSGGSAEMVFAGISFQSSAGSPAKPAFYYSQL